jgi:general L-amino acid transport system substrate-binding protein
MKLRNLVLAGMAVALSASALVFPRTTEAQDGGLLATVRERGNLVCGVNGGLAGFGFVDPEGRASGFDVDFCRVIAAAVLGDAEAVEFRPVAAADRFTAIAAGEIDVLVRNTTYTYDRDTVQGADFGPTIFYDGQTVLVREADGIADIAGLDGLTVCVIKGTTSEQNISDTAAAAGVEITLVPFDDIGQVMDSFAAGRCDAATSDRSQLAVQRATREGGSEWVLFAENISREPLTPAYRAGDAQWGDVVRWAIYATIIAEEYGVTSQNIDEQIADPALNPELKRLFGLEGETYAALGFEQNWAQNVIRSVGNYGEIYERNLGASTDINIERGLNNLYTNDGLLYAPPFR